MKQVKEWALIILSGAFGVFIMAFSVVIAWSAIVKVVMTPIQWWNGNCTVEYSK
jgi:hypothetical protein